MSHVRMPEPDYRNGRYHRYGRTIEDHGETDIVLIAETYLWAASSGRTVQPDSVTIRRDAGRIRIACAAR